MRFAIALLTVICIASIIGTVLKQQEPINNYINQFGPFWAEVFGALGLFAVYSAWWFLLILLFLVISTSLCVARNTPQILRDFKNFKEHLRESSFKAFGHNTAWNASSTVERSVARIQSAFSSIGWKTKTQQRPDGTLIAAKAGAGHKIGYIAAHSAIVLVCVGGLLDGDLIVRAQMWFNGKSAYTGGGLISDVKPEHRLGEFNPTFRANLLVAEGTRSSTAVIGQPSGVLIQDLPFAVELKKFIVEYYSTGMPKLFASDIVIHDIHTGEQVPARVEVNHPARYKGVEIYQSSFDDGGSTVKLKAYPVKAAVKPFEVQGVIGGKSELLRGQGLDAEKLTLEYTALRVINVENLGGNTGANGGVDVRKVDLKDAIDARLGAANKGDVKKNMRNVGPSITYKLRDASGQAREFHNYMLPVDTGDGVPVFLLGARDSPSEGFRYMRIPADDAGGLEGFARLRDALGVAVPIGLPTAFTDPVDAPSLFAVASGGALLSPSVKARIRELLPTETPAGLITHIAVKRDGLILEEREKEPRGDFMTSLVQSRYKDGSKPDLTVLAPGTLLPIHPVAFLVLTARKVDRKSVV